MVLLVSVVFITVLATLVLVAVAYPYRGRSTRRLPWLGRALAASIAQVRPTDPAPPQPLLSDPDLDARMRERIERVEQGIVGGVRRVTSRR